MSRQVTPQEIVEEVINGLTVTLTVAAARACIGDDEAWLQRLQHAVQVPMELYRFTGDPGLLLEAVQSVMGAGWSPPGDWASYIEAVSQIQVSPDA